MERGLGTLASFVLLAGALALAVFQTPPENKVVVLDVGQGDAILLQEHTNQILIDGGPGDTVLTRLAEEMPQLDKRIEVVINTHPDKDHVAGLLDVVTHYDVGLVLLPEVSHDSNLYNEWISVLLNKLDDKQIQYRFARAGQRIEAGEMLVTILGPIDLQLRGSNLNNASVVTRVDFGDLSFMFTGDAEIQAEQSLVARVPASMLDVDILKAGHHGSKTSSTTQFLRVTSPSAVLISAGKGNQYGHPSDVVMQRIQNLSTWRTDTQGSIGFYENSGNWFAKTQR